MTVTVGGDPTASSRLRHQPLRLVPEGGVGDEAGPWQTQPTIFLVPS